MKIENLTQEMLREIRQKPDTGGIEAWNLYKEYDRYREQERAKARYEVARIRANDYRMRFLFRTGMTMKEAYRKYGTACTSVVLKCIEIEKKNGRT